MRNKEVAVRHIEKLDTCFERITYLLESWFGDKTERPINEALRYVKEGHQVEIFCSDSDKYKIIKKKFEIIDGVKVF